MTREEWCARADAQGYNLDGARDAIDCQLMNTGADMTSSVVVCVILIAAGLALFLVSLRAHP